MILTRNAVSHLLPNPEVIKAFPSLATIAKEISDIKSQPVRGCNKGCGGNTAGANGVSINSLLQKGLSILDNSTQNQIDLLKKELKASVLYIYGKNQTGDTVLKKLGK
jgi:hypothetical protein